MPANVVKIGDPHLGRRFINGVPLPRRGEREKQVWAEFTRQMTELPAGTTHVVVMGDLFDKFVVPPEVVLEAARVTITAAMRHQSVQFAVLRGNHDAVREIKRNSSFDEYFQMVYQLPNVRVAREWPVAVDNFLYVPWHPFNNAEAMLASVVEAGTQYEAVFGHWDIESFGGNTDNLCPYESLSKITKNVFTGHVHKPSAFQTHGMDVTVVGSMLPYAHGEEVEDEQYVTMTIAEFEASDHAEIRDKNLRILLGPGEKLPPNIDALQVTAKRVDAEGNEDLAEVSMEAFDFKKLFADVMTEKGVSVEVQSDLWARYESKRASKNSS